MISKYHKPEQLVGLDFSGEAVKLCNRKLSAGGLVFVEGEAEHMPFSAGSFDVVINVESSHCYSSMTSFLHEVIKVLRPGGYFLFTDFRKPYEIEKLDQLITASGLALLTKETLLPTFSKPLTKITTAGCKQFRKKYPGSL